jgi:hypothetical protein
VVENCREIIRRFAGRRLCAITLLAGSLALGLCAKSRRVSPLRKRLPKSFGYARLRFKGNTLNVDSQFVRFARQP